VLCVLPANEAAQMIWTVVAIATIVVVTLCVQLAARVAPITRDYVQAGMVAAGMLLVILAAVLLLVAIFGAGA
jgi:hypothetical protein